MLSGAHGGRWLPFISAQVRERHKLGEVVGDDLCRPRCGSAPFAHGRHQVGGWARGKPHPRLACLVIVKNSGRQAGKINRKRNRCREDQVCIEAPMQKEKNVEDGLQTERTPDDQAAGPAYTPSELLDMAPCQAETDITYLYIEVLRFFYNAIGCPRRPLTPVHQRPSSSEATNWETAWETQCPRRAAQRHPTHGRHIVAILD